MPDPMLECTVAEDLYAEDAAGGDVPQSGVRVPGDPPGVGPTPCPAAAPTPPAGRGAPPAGAAAGGAVPQSGVRVPGAPPGVGPTPCPAAVPTTPAGRGRPRGPGTPERHCRVGWLPPS